MKKKVLVLLSLALVLSVNLRSQVTIGGLTTPKAGALLDLNSTTPGGLVLSNVDLDDLSKIPANRFVGISAAQDRNLSLAGMIVYNTKTTTGVGIHVWDGDDWIKPCAPPAPGPITLSTTKICVGSTLTAKINSVNSATKYVWTLPAGLTGTSNDTIITITAKTAGNYPAGSITVRAESSCGGGTRRPGTQAIVINAIPAAPTNPRVTSSGSNLRFEADPQSGCTIDWYAVPFGGSPISGGSNTSFLLVNNVAQTYYAESRNLTTGCVSTSRLTITGLPVVSNCASTPNFTVVVTAANVDFVSPTETATESGLIFSAPVKIVGLPARTTQFNGGTSVTDARADYRDHTSADNTNTYGSWFSWCMVVQYADVLCSNGWRVPTKDEFVTYYNAETSAGVTVKSGMHGWLLGGEASRNGSTTSVGSMGLYWSSTITANNAYDAQVTGNNFHPASYNSRIGGFSLRCVK
ncbi:MAG: hypothetical protein LBP72_01990 [Dysgonamonadaceae bacterium]|jgi:uncharacterized protein (TIGR02145 family)|nr:hypothetical protein [Dysgonamonadaceae bacterium]